MNQFARQHADLLVNYIIREKLIDIKSEYLLRIENSEWMASGTEDKNRIEELQRDIQGAREYVSVLDEYIAKFKSVELHHYFNNL
jgi:hypothetical protein